MRVDSESGLTGYDISYVNVTDLHSVDKSHGWIRPTHSPRNTADGLMNRSLYTQ